VHINLRHPINTPSPGQRIIVIDAILFSFSTPRTINLSKTCRAARPIATFYFRAAYNPERLLQQFLLNPATVRAFRTLQAETGLTIFGKAAYNFLRVHLFTGAGYDVETREHDFVFLKTGEDDRITNKIVLHVGQPDSFDFVDRPQILLIGTCYVVAQVSTGRYHETLMSTYPFLYRVYGRHYIRWRTFPFPGSIR
jgi:hypothetical protein